MFKKNPFKQPKVIRMPLRFKITLPYLFLAMVLSIGVGFLATKIIFDTIDERFTNQLYEAGKLAADYVKNEENRLLGTLRALSHTEGVAEAVGQGDGDNLRELTFGSVVNNQEEAVEFLDTQGNLVLSMRHKKGGKLEEYNFSKGGSVFAQWDIVKNVIAAKSDSLGDKYSAYYRTGWGDYFYVSGPIHDKNNNFVGVILVGKTLSTLVRQVRENTLAQVTFYSFGGQPLASTYTNPITLDPATEQSVLVNQDTSSYRRNVSRRDLNMGELNYGEILGPWESRRSRSWCYRLVLNKECVGDSERTDPPGDPPSYHFHCIYHPHCRFQPGRFNHATVDNAGERLTRGGRGSFTGPGARR